MTEPSNGDASDRRWLIGIAVSIFFGLFGAVMAVLAYRDRGHDPAPPVAPTPTVYVHTPAAPTPLASAPVAPTPVAPTAAPTSDAHDNPGKKHHK